MSVESSQSNALSEESSQQQVQKVLFLLRKMHKGVKRTSVVSSQSNAVSEESSQQQVQKVLFLLRKMQKGVKRMSEESSQSNGVSEESSQYPLRLGPLCLWAVRRTVNEQNI